MTDPKSGESTNPYESPKQECDGEASLPRNRFGDTEDRLPGLGLVAGILMWTILWPMLVHAVISIPKPFEYVASMLGMAACVLVISLLDLRRSPGKFRRQRVVRALGFSGLIVLTGIVASAAEFAVPGSAGMAWFASLCVLGVAGTCWSFVAR